MKRGFVGLIFLLFIMPLVLQFSIVSSQEIPGLPQGFSPEELLERQAELEQLKNQTHWQLLGERFKISLLQNPIIAAIDGFFTKISFLFRILFGMSYELSITLLFVIALWLLVFIDLGNILSKYSILSALASYGISFAIAVIFGQVQIFKILVNYIGTLIYSREAWWARTLIIFAVILIFIFADQLSRYLGKYLQGLKEAREKAETLAAGQEIQKFARGMEEGREIVK